VIGCNVLANPFFFSEEQWVPVPKSWAPSIVQGKGYDADKGEGATLWEAVQAAMENSAGMQARTRSYAELGGERFGAEYLMRSRLGQGAFRVLVTLAYDKRCAVTGERTLPVLEAAHIKPYALEGPHQVQNGVLLRSDLHKLFDLGYVTVTPALRLEVSSRLREEWQNGREYYTHHGKELAYRPLDPGSLPSREFLSWHNEKVFRT
jgi:putative restriction endonuclease